MRKGMRAGVASLAVGVGALVVGCAPVSGPDPLPACDAVELEAAYVEAYPGAIDSFGVVGCIDEWAAGSVVLERFAPPISVLFKAIGGEWIAVDRGFGMCSHQGVPADIARQFGCLP